MIKNVIFDFGQVMIHFDPKYITEQYIKGEEAQLVEQAVFDTAHWYKLDSGEISDEEVISICHSRLPRRLWETAERVYFNWIYHLPEIDGMRDIVKKLKAKGIRVLLLSNISKYFADHAAQIDTLSDFEGCVFSAAVGMIKPNADIFEYICTKYALNPSETVFVDDNSANVAGAERYGIKGYLFDGDASKLSQYLSL